MRHSPLLRTYGSRNRPIGLTNFNSIFNDMSGNKTRDTEQAGTCRAFAADLVRVCGQPQLNAVTPQNTPFELVGRTGIICAQLSDEDANARAYQLWDGEGELPSELLSAATLQFWRLPQSEDEIVTTSDGTELLASDEAYVYNPHDGFVGGVDICCVGTAGRHRR